MSVCSGYYAWRLRPRGRAEADHRLRRVLRRLHRQTREQYGAGKRWRLLTTTGIVCGWHRVARLRRQAGIEARRVRRFCVIVERHRAPTARPNAASWQCIPSRPASTPSGSVDMTADPGPARGGCTSQYSLICIPRRVIAWAMRAKPDQCLTLVALSMACDNGRRFRGLCITSDEGAQYSSVRNRQHLTCARHHAEHEPQAALARLCRGGMRLQHAQERTHSSSNLRSDEASQDIFVHLSASEPGLRQVRWSSGRRISDRAGNSSVHGPQASSGCLFLMSRDLLRRL